MDAVAGLQRGRLLHGDIKMLNAVLHEDRFKLIDLAGVTSYD